MTTLEQRLRDHAPLWGRWTPGARIYHGRHCAVYALTAQRPGGELEAAVKVVTLTGRGAALEADLQDALAEVRAMERLRDCAHVVQLRDDACFPLREDGEVVGCDVLLRMDRLTCLTELLREGEALDAAEVRRLAWDLAGALRAAHEAGIVHRDVKPANIYRTAQGRYQLGDFSVARVREDAMLETMTGTAAYMAPEVARGDGYDHRADLYSLGVVLYQLLNGNFLPQTGEGSTLAQREQALRRRWDGARLPPPAGGDRAFQKIVLRCCAPNPDRRFSDAQSLLDALEPPRAGRFWVPAALTGWGFAVLATTALLLMPSYLGRLAPQAADAPPAETVQAPADTPDVPDTPPAEPAPDVLVQPEATRRYTVVQAQMTWDEARAYCESRGGHLATILDRAQQEAVAALLAEHGVEYAWLGASNLNTSGGFQWTTGEPFSYALWALGEPNNANGVEHYLMMMYRGEDEGWVWNDSHERGMWNFGADQCGFVCQWDEADG